MTLIALELLETHPQAHLDEASRAVRIERAIFILECLNLHFARVSLRNFRRRIDRNREEEARGLRDVLPHIVLAHAHDEFFCFLSKKRSLDEAIEREYRRQFFDGIKTGYAELRADPRAWKEYQAELHAWDVTLLDGLDPNERWPELERRQRSKRSV